MSKVLQGPLRSVKRDTSALIWRKSSLSIANGNCVEAAQFPDGYLAVRDSKDKTGPTLLFTTNEWHAFIQGAKKGEFDF